MKMLNKKIAFVAIGAFALTGIGFSQFRQVLKIVGVGAAVKQFGPDINKAINKLSNHQDSQTVITKVVPIISGGINSRQSIGAAQVMGPRAQVEQVQAVAQLEQDLFGREVKVRAMVPVSTERIVENIRRVEGVGISGIVDLKL